MTRTDWDPAVSELLREIVRDERSTLNELPPPTIGELLRPRAVPTGTPFLTKAEKHLLAIHRETVAGLMVDAAFAMMFGPGGWSDRFTDFVTNTRREPISSEAVIRERARRVPDLPRADEEQSALELVKRWARGADFGRPGLVDLLARSVRLVPAFRARLLLVPSLAVSGQPRSAIRLAATLLRRARRRRARADILEYAGLAYYELGDTPRALRAYRGSYALNEGYALPTCAYLFNAVQLGHRREAMRAASALGELGAESDAIVSFAHEAMLHQRNEGRWSPTRSSRGMVRALRRTSDEEAVNRVLAVFD